MQDDGEVRRKGRPKLPLMEVVRIDLKKMQSAWCFVPRKIRMKIYNSLTSTLLGQDLNDDDDDDDDNF